MTDTSTAQERSDTVTLIARRIADRAKVQGWKGKRGDAAAIDAWAGAVAGYMVAKGCTPDAEDATASHLARVCFLNIARDPLKETLRLADRITQHEGA